MLVTLWSLGLFFKRLYQFKVFQCLSWFSSIFKMLTVEWQLMKNLWLKKLWCAQPLNFTSKFLSVKLILPVKNVWCDSSVCEKTVKFCMNFCFKLAQCDPSPSQGLADITFATINIFTPVERGTLKIKCLTHYMYNTTALTREWKWSCRTEYLIISERAVFLLKSIQNNPVSKKI